MVRAFLQLMGLSLWVAAILTLIAGTLNSLFGWNLALKTGGSTIPLPEDFVGAIMGAIALAILGAIFYALGNLKRTWALLRRYRWFMLIGLALTTALVIIGIPMAMPDLMLELAVQGGNTAKAQSLLQKRDYPDELLNDLLYWSIQSDDQAITQMMIDQGADIHQQRGEFNSTLLHNAVAFMPASATDVLLEKGIDVNAKDDKQRNALHSLLNSREFYADDADESEILAITKKLVEAGIDVNATNSFADTPLSLAQSRGYDSVVDYLQQL